MRRFFKHVDKNLIIITLFGLIPFLWFIRGVLVSEEYYAVNYGNWARLVNEPWIMFANYGWSGIWAAMLPQSLFFMFIQNLLNSYHLTLIIWHVLLWVMPGIFFYLAVNELFSKTINKFAILLGAGFYVFNPFFLNIHFLLTPPRILALALPAVLYIAAKYKSPFWIALVSTLFSTIFVNIPLGAVYVFYILLVSFGVFLKVHKDISKAFIRTSTTLGLFLLFNIWWILPIYINVYSKVASVQQNTSNFSAISATHLSDSLSIFGSWAFREKYNDIDYYFPYNIQYDAFPMVYLKYLPIFILLYFIYRFITQNKNSENKSNTENGVVVLISISFYLFFAILAKGTTGIFGDVYRLLTEMLPGFWIFREPYAKFGLVAGFFLAISLTAGLNSLFSDINSKKYRLLLTTVLTLSLISLGFPYYKIGDFTAKLKYAPSPEFKEFINIFKPHEGYYMLVPSKGLHTQYNWENFHSGNPIVLETLANIIYKPDYFSENSKLNSVLNYLFKIVQEDPKKILEVANRYAIRGIVLQKETVYFHPETAEKIKQSLLTSQIFTNTSVDLYEFSAPNMIDLIPSANILTMSSNLIDKYDTIKKFISPEYYLVINDEKESDIINPEATIKDYFAGEYTYETSSSLGSDVTIFNDYLPHVENNGKKLDLVENADKVYSYKIDSSINNSSKIILFPPEIKPVGDAWIYYDFLTNKIVQEVNFENIKQYTGFLSKLSLDSIPRHLMLTINKQTIQKPYLVGIAYGDPAKGIVIDLGDAKILDPSKNINLVLNTRLLDFYKEQYPQGVMYVFVQPLSTSFSLQYINTGLGYSAIDIPDVYFNRKKVTAATKKDLANTSSGEYSKVTNSIHLYKNIQNHKDKILMFKQAYNSNWRLLSTNNNIVNCQDYSCKTVDKIKLYWHILFNMNSSVVPDYNIEYYATGWDLEGRNYESVVLYYQPTIIYYLSLLIFVVSVPTVYYYRKKFL